MEDEIPVLERIERENSADSESSAPLLVPVNGNGLRPTSSAHVSLDGHLAEEEGSWRPYEDVLKEGLRMRPTEEERAKFAFNMAREHISLQSHMAFNPARTFIIGGGEFQILKKEEIRAILERRGSPPIDRVDDDRIDDGPSPAPSQVPLPTPDPTEHPIQQQHQQQPEDLPTLPPLPPTPPRPSSPPLRPPRNAYGRTDSPETIGRVNQILQDAQHEVEAQNKAKEAASAPRGRNRSRRGGGARNGGAAAGPSRNAVHALSPPHRRRSPSYSPESRMMPVIRAKEPEPIDGWEAAAVFQSAPIDDRDRSPTPAEEELFPDDPIEDPEAEQEEEEAAAGADDVDISADSARDGSPMPVEKTIGETAPATDEAMDTSADIANASTDSGDKASTSAPKAKKKYSELNSLLNMDFGPKEGGRAEQIISWGTRVRKTVTPAAPVQRPTRKVLPKRNSERKKDNKEEEEEEKGDGEGTSGTPTTRSSRRKRGGAQEAEKTTPVKTPRRGVSKDAELQAAAASEAEKKTEAAKTAPAANSDAPPVLTPVEGTSPEPPADLTSAAAASTPGQTEPVRLAQMFSVDGNGLPTTAPPPQPAAHLAPPATATPNAPVTATVRVVRAPNAMDLADRLQQQKGIQKAHHDQQQQIQQESLAERQRAVEMQRQQDEQARKYMQSAQEMAARQQAMERARAEELSRMEIQRRRQQEQEERARLEREIQRENREREVQQREQDLLQRALADRTQQQQQQPPRQRALIQPSPGIGFSNQLPPHLRPSPPTQQQQQQMQQHQLQLQQHHQMLLTQHQQQQQNQPRRRTTGSQIHILRTNRGTPQQPPQPYRLPVQAQVHVAPPALIPQIPAPIPQAPAPVTQAPAPVTARPASMPEPVRPVLELLEGENDMIDFIPLPQGKINYYNWAAVEFAEWAKQALPGPKGNEMSEIIIKDDHQGTFVEEFIKNSDEMVKLYSLNPSHVIKLKAVATATVNRQKKHAHQTKMRVYEEQMRIFNSSR